MKIIETSLSGLKILEHARFKDNRGDFIKIFSNDFFKEHNLNINIKEIYYSISRKNVIRGMHFQTPPHEHLKIVYVPIGRILDVILDLRKNSHTYGKYFKLELSAKDSKILIIPSGMAHGFKSLEDNTNVSYIQTSCYSSKHDFGIKYDSFGFNWDIQNPIISERDLSFENFNDFKTPFI